MKPHPRIRKTVKWGGAVVSLLVAAVWIASFGWWVSWLRPDGYFCTVGGGSIDFGHAVGQVGYLEDGEPVMLSYGRVSEAGLATRWWFKWGNKQGVRGGAIPLWVPIVVVLLPTIFVWHLDHRARRRARAGLCAMCGYNRTGLPAGAVCPECGEVSA